MKQNKTTSILNNITNVNNSKTVSPLKCYFGCDVALLVQSGRHSCGPPVNQSAEADAQLLK